MVCVQSAVLVFISDDHKLSNEFSFQVFQENVLR